MSSRLTKGPKSIPRAGYCFVFLALLSTSSEPSPPHPPPRHPPPPPGSTAGRVCSHGTLPKMFSCCCWDGFCNERTHSLYKFKYIFSPVERPQCWSKREGAFDLDGEKLGNWIRVRNRAFLPSCTFRAWAGARVRIGAREDQNVVNDVN